MTTCYQKHPFEVENEDHLTTINSKIFEIKKKIQLSEGQRKSHFEENEAEKQQNNDLIETLKKEVKRRLKELAEARVLVGEDEGQIKKYLNEVCPMGSKTTEQIIHNLDLKVIEQRKMLDLLKYERKNKKGKLKFLEKEYEELLIEDSKSANERIKSANPIRKHASHLENEIHKVIAQWNEAELVKKKYYSIRNALSDDSVKFESSLYQIAFLLQTQREEIAKLELVREEAIEMRAKATASIAIAGGEAKDADHAHEAERAYYALRFEERKRELEKLEKIIFPPPVRVVVRQESTGSTEAAATVEETTAIALMENTFQKLMKLTGASEADEVLDRFRMQRETSSRLGYLQNSTEQEKLGLEDQQNNLIGQLEIFKFAQVKDKDEAHDKILELKEQIVKEDERRALLEVELNDVNNMLMEIKKLLFDLCKLMDIIPDPPTPEWTVEVRDVSGILDALRGKHSAACARAQSIADRAQDGVVPIALPSSGAASATGASTRSHSTSREAEPPAPTYKELLQREPEKPPASEEEEDLPSRSYLKRQAQLIVDTKTRRKGFRPPLFRK